LLLSNFDINDKQMENGEKDRRRKNSIYHLMKISHGSNIRKGTGVASKYEQ
jgi:hypothetical protein